MTDHKIQPGEPFTFIRADWLLRADGSRVAAGDDTHLEVRGKSHAGKFRVTAVHERGPTIVAYETIYLGPSPL